MNTSTDKRGLSKEEYQRRQEQCEAEKFTVQTNKRLQDIELSLREHEKQLNTHQAFQGEIKSDVSSQINEIITLTMGSLKEFRQAIGDFDTHMKKQDAKLQAMKEQQDLLASEEDVGIWNSSLWEAIKDIHSKIDLIRKENNGLIDRLKIDLFNQIKSLREELIARPTGLPELQRLLESKIELVELNGQNAVLRSSNNEKQLLLVDRKIDNIYQLIKKLELSKQE